MPRAIQIVVPLGEGDEVVSQVRPISGVLSVIAQPGSSVEPPGDVISVTATNDGTRRLLVVLDRLGVLSSGSVVTSEAKAVISSANRTADREPNETIWEEMAFLLRRETNVQFNYLALMAVAGAVAAVGLWTDALHLVIGAMVIAPGFEPIIRIPFGVVAGPRSLALGGARSVVAGYAAMGAGAAVAFLLARELQAAPPLDQHALVTYWSSTTATATLVVAVAAFAGAVVVAAQRSVLSAGVMIALALVPSASITGMALVADDPSLAGRAAQRWLLETGVILVMALVVFELKQVLLQKRRSQR